jgi:hypothetical protein
MIPGSTQGISFDISSTDYNNEWAVFNLLIVVSRDVENLCSHYNLSIHWVSQDEKQDSPGVYTGDVIRIWDIYKWQSIYGEIKDSKQFRKIREAILCTAFHEIGHHLYYLRGSVMGNDQFSIEVAAWQYGAQFLKSFDIEEKIYYAYMIDALKRYVNPNLILKTPKG